MGHVRAIDWLLETSLTLLWNLLEVVSLIPFTTCNSYGMLHYLDNHKDLIKGQ